MWPWGLWVGEDRHCALTFSQLTCALPQEALDWCLKSAGLEAFVFAIQQVQQLVSPPLRFNTCHLSVSKLQRSKFPKTDLLCVLNVSGAAVHGDGLNSIFFLGFCSIKIATFTLHSDKWEIYSLELWVTTGHSQKATLLSNWAPASGFRVSCQVCTCVGLCKERVVTRTVYITCEAQCKMKMWGP